MAKYLGPKCRLCRREGLKLFLKGERCFTAKCSMDQKRKPYPPGEHGQRRKKSTDYGVQLREKEKVRRIYGVLEKQFRLCFERAERMRGATGENLLTLLERRLDNVIFRLGFAVNRAEAKQLVGHRHFRLNGRRVSIPSITVKEGDVIEVVDRSRKITPITTSLENVERRGLPQWLELDKNAFKGTVRSMPTRDDVQMEINERLIVELYSK